MQIWGKAAARLRAVALTVAVAAGLVVVPPAQAETVHWLTGAPFAQCVDDVPVFTVKPNGDLWLYSHQGARSGKTPWGAAKQIGSGWLGRTLAGPDGVVYSVETGGALKRFRWNGGGWDNAAGEVKAQGWQRYAAEGRNLVTVDSAERLYTVDAQGDLRVHPENKVIAEGWDSYDLIVAAGDGVLYSRTPAGVLQRHAYDHKSGKWVQRAQIVGSGWQMFTKVFSAGGDVLYGVTASGELKWHRYVNPLNQWVVSDTAAGVQVGTGWGADRDTVAGANACQARNPLDIVQRVGSTAFVGVSVAYILSEIKVVVEENVRADGPFGSAVKAVHDNKDLLLQLADRAATDAGKPEFAEALRTALGGKTPDELKALLQKEIGEHSKIRQYLGGIDAIVDYLVTLTKVTIEFVKATDEALTGLAGMKIDIDVEALERNNREMAATLDGMIAALDQMNRGMDQMNAGIAQMNEGIAQTNKAIREINAAMDQMNAGLARTNAAVAALNNGGWNFFSNFNIDLKDLRIDLENLFGRPEPEFKKKYQAQMFSATLDLIPFLGDAKGVLEGITGQNYVTGERVEGVERALGAIIFVRSMKGAYKGADSVYNGWRLAEVYRTWEKANPMIDSLRRTGGLPPNYITQDVAKDVYGWEKGKALGNLAPGKALGGDVYRNLDGTLPPAPGRVWYEADIGQDYALKRKNNPGTRLLYSNDGEMWITTDHYETFDYVGRYTPR